jgi:hypothetical protein
MSHKYQQIKGIDNVICGSQLTETDIKCIKLSLIIEDDENIVRLWACGGWNKEFNISDILVGITDKAIFKFENHKLERFLLTNISYVSHIKNGLFKWDKIKIHLKNNSVDTFGVYHSSACDHYVDFINRLIKSKN